MLSLQDIWLKRFKAWIDERFALKNALLFFVLYLTTAVVARHTMQAAALFSLYDVAGALILWSFFLLLRILDEHKDYALDTVNHPQRVLQSGLITLKQLRRVAILAVIYQFAYALWRDSGWGGACWAWVYLIAWTILMTKEFFVGEWLQRHLTLYAFSHMLIMPFIIWWSAKLAAPSVLLSPSLICLMILAFISGFCFEITRKTKGLDEERDGVDSYSKIFGATGSTILIILLSTAMLISQLGLLYCAIHTVYGWAAGLLTISYAVSLWQLLCFIKRPTSTGREKNETSVALNMLLGYAVIIMAITYS